MPELPEVEIIVRELREKIVNETISDIRVYWPRTWVAEKGIDPRGQKITALGRQGKYIVISLNRNFLVVHLRMTGQLIFDGAGKSDDKHLRLQLIFTSGRSLDYFDARKFGRVYFTSDPKTILKSLGIDTLSSEFTAKVFHQILMKSSMRIKSLLLDQKYIAGLGNIYIDESLFEAQIHPRTPANKLPDKEVNALFIAIRNILNRSIANMGTTLSDYRTTGGGFGDNQHYLKIYGRDGEACFTCAEVIRKIRVNNRGTHFCPTCQPEKEFNP